MKSTHEIWLIVIPPSFLMKTFRHLNTSFKQLGNWKNTNLDYTKNRMFIIGKDRLNINMSEAFWRDTKQNWKYRNKTISLIAKVRRIFCCKWMVFLQDKNIYKSHLHDLDDFPFGFNSPMQVKYEDSLISW